MKCDKTFLESCLFCSNKTSLSAGGQAADCTGENVVCVTVVEKKIGCTVSDKKIEFELGSNFPSNHVSGFIFHHFFKTLGVYFAPLREVLFCSMLI